MAVDSNALTLAEIAVQSRDPLQQRLAYSLYAEGSMLQDIPLVTRDGMMRMDFTRYGAGDLPSVNWRKLNEEPTVVKSKAKQYSEDAYIMSAKFTVEDRLLRMPNQIQSPLTTQMDAWMRSKTREFNYRFINNDPNNTTSGDEDAFKGLRYRLDNPTEFGIPSEMKINAGGVVIVPGSVTAATANSFLVYVDQMLDLIGAPDGNNVVLYMDGEVKRAFAAAVRILGEGAGFRSTEDAFGRRIEMFRNAKVRDAGRKIDDSTPVILPYETAAGADGVSGTDLYSSIYAVKYGEGKFSGWQTEALKPKDLGLSTENGILRNVVVDWGVGLWQEDARSIARLYNIKLR